MGWLVEPQAPLCAYFITHQRLANPRLQPGSLTNLSSKTGRAVWTLGLRWNLDFHSRHYPARSWSIRVFSCGSDSRGPVTGASLWVVERKVMGHPFCCLQSRQRHCGPGTQSGGSFLIYTSRQRQRGLGARNRNRDFPNLHLPGRRSSCGGPILLIHSRRRAWKFCLHLGGRNEAEGTCCLSV